MVAALVVAGGVDQPLVSPTSKRCKCPSIAVALKDITRNVTPVLHDEVLQAQSAQIDLIFGRPMPAMPTSNQCKRRSIVSGPERRVVRRVDRVC